MNPMNSSRLRLTKAKADSFYLLELLLSDILGGVSTMHVLRLVHFGAEIWTYLFFLDFFFFRVPRGLTLLLLGFGTVDGGRHPVQGWT